MIARAWFFSEVTSREQRSWVWLGSGHFEWFLLWWGVCFKTCSIKFLQIGELQCTICRHHELLLLWPQICRAWLKFCQSQAYRLKLKIDSLSLLSVLLPHTAHRINYLHAVWLVPDLILPPIWKAFLASLFKVHHIIMKFFFVWFSFFNWTSWEVDLYLVLNFGFLNPKYMRNSNSVYQKRNNFNAM